MVQLILKNFQVHEYLVVDFGKVTCLVGQTDVGKSAVLRALRWVCLNDIGGEEFITHGKRQCVVCLKVKVKNEQHTIWRIRGGGENIYKLDDKEYKSFGNTVPADIVKLLNVNEINFQSQHDAPYWFSETAGEVSRQLNNIVDLSVIDTALSNVASEVRKANERKEFSEERLTAAQKEYDELEPQKQRVSDFERLQLLDTAYEDADQDYGRLESLGDRIYSNKNDFKRIQEKAVDGERLLEFARTARRSDARFTSLEEITRDICHYREQSEPPPDFAVVENKWKVLDQLDFQVEAVLEYIKEIERLKEKSYNMEKLLERSENNFHKIIRGMKCPTCNKPL